MICWRLEFSEFAKICRVIFPWYLSIYRPQLFEQGFFKAHFCVQVISYGHNVTFGKPLLNCIQFLIEDLFPLCVGSLRWWVVQYYCPIEIHIFWSRSSEGCSLMDTINICLITYSHLLLIGFPEMCILFIFLVRQTRNTLSKFLISNLQGSYYLSDMHQINT